MGGRERGREEEEEEEGEGRERERGEGEREGERERERERGGGEGEKGNRFQKFSFQIDEKVDARDLSMGAWFEAQVVKITAESLGTDNPCSSTTQLDDIIYYHVRYDE